MGHDDPRIRGLHVELQSLDKRAQRIVIRARSDGHPLSPEQNAALAAIAERRIAVEAELQALAA
jgi:hypothetical protein